MDSFLAGPHIQAIQISCQLYSNVDIEDSWAHQILQRAHKISNGPLKFGNLHVFEWDMGHSPILRAHHHFGLGLTLSTHRDSREFQTSSPTVLLSRSLLGVLC